jgi:hypothetical protein
MKNGYVMLVSVLVFTVVGAVIALSTMTMGIMSSQNNEATIYSAQARGLAHACGEMALLEIQSNNLYTGATVETIGNGVCEYDVTITGLGRDVDVESEVNGYFYRLEIELDQVNPTINIASWQEVN